MPLFTLLVLGPTVGLAAQTSDLKVGDVLSKSAKFLARTYKLSSPSDRAALAIRGNNLVIDFGGATLLGSGPSTPPDERAGTAIRVEGRNITIKNLKLHGYKVGIHAANSPGLRIVNSDLSYNWKQRLRSTTDREDGGDWMSYHRNEKDEWLRYGAAIYLRDCDQFEVSGVRVVGGQNALMITGCDKGKIWNNNFSFNSSLGLGMYQCSDNRVMHNRMDWNVRGFSYGVYNRGQDSAGILIYEQSHRNIFAYNSVTHGGDGFFLWAGQTTMDTGKGGCNDNILYGNDWSHAPTNGIEATFARNVFVNNKIHECAHGVWGGYSFDSVIAGNDFAENQAAIAIEHGQANKISHNTFDRDDVGISLWQNATQPADWGYAKYRDTRSRDYSITQNRFDGVGVALDQRVTANTRFDQNTLFNVFRELRTPEAEAKPVGTNTAVLQNAKRPEWNPWTTRRELTKYVIPPMKGGQDPFLKKNALRGWKYILVDDWGPYDFQRPLLWPERVPLAGEAPRPGANSAAGSGRPRPQRPPQTGPTRYEILGPKGRWRAVRTEGVTLSAQSGTVPGFVTIDMEKGRVGVTEVELEYLGAETTDSWGRRTPAGKPVSFGFKRFNAPIDWTVNFFNWTASVDKNDPIAIPVASHYATVTGGTPIHTLKTTELNYSSGGGFYPGGPRDKFAAVANGTFEVPAGEYTFDVTVDDGIRLYVDDKLVLESWKHQGPTPYAVNLKLGGKHRIRLEYFEIGGFAALQVKLKPKG